MSYRDSIKQAATRHEYFKTHRADFNARHHAYRDCLKAAVIAFYSAGTMACAQCGINDIDVLCLNHIDDDGVKQRKELLGRNAGGHIFYQALKNLGFPPGLQVLCANCNMKKEVEQRRRRRNCKVSYSSAARIGG